VCYEFSAVKWDLASWWPRSMASQPSSQVHRGQSWIKSGDSRNRRLLGFERKSFLASIQTEPRILTLRVCRCAKSRARQAHDDIHSGEAGVHCTRMRLLRPAAFKQIVSPRRRREPRRLASYIDKLPYRIAKEIFPWRLTDVPLRPRLSLEQPLR